MAKKKDTPKNPPVVPDVNPDVVVLPDGSLRLTLAVDKINSGYEGVEIEGKEATYDERREAMYRSDRPMSYPRHQCSRAKFTVPVEQARGYAIGSIIVVTIAKDGR